MAPHSRRSGKCRRIGIPYVNGNEMFEFCSLNVNLDSKFSRKKEGGRKQTICPPKERFFRVRARKFVWDHPLQGLRMAPLEPIFWHTKRDVCQKVGSSSFVPSLCTDDDQTLYRVVWGLLCWGSLSRERAIGTIRTCLPKRKEKNQLHTAGLFFLETHTNN